MSGPAPAPPLDGVLETALYVEDLDEAAAFYLNILGLSLIFSDPRMIALDTGGDRVLLLFRRGVSAAAVDTPGGTIPAHDGAGPVHIAFAVAGNDLPAWEDRLARHAIGIESRVDWPRGGTSLYFRDPDGHLLELAPRRLWARR